MPRKAKFIPSYRRQKRRDLPDLAFVEFNGKRAYLGEFGSESSRQEYARLVAEHQTDSASPVVEADGLTIAELVAEFWLHAEKHYKAPGGGTTSELDCYRQATRPFVGLYGNTLAGEFGPRALKVLRQAMIDTGWSRPYVNAQIGRIKRVFKWAVGEGIVASTVLHGLQAVTGLQYGRSEAPEPERVKPVPDETVDKTLPYLTPTVKAMVELQRFTGMRPGEVCSMRTCDIDTTGKTWVYQPPEHKLSWRGKDRKVFIGPRAQRVLKPWLRADLQAHIFSPAQSKAEWLERRKAQREIPDTYGNGPGTNRVTDPKRKPGERFGVSSYGHSIAYACRQAWPVPDNLADDPRAVDKWHRDHRWTPNQLRHSFATHVRREHGVDLAGALLGHSPGSTITATYAERSESLAIEVVKRIG